MTHILFDATLREQQVANALLAHAARADDTALTTSLMMIADPAEELRAVQLLAVLLDYFQAGMATEDTLGLADYFAQAALNTAVNDD